MNDAPRDPVRLAAPRPRARLWPIAILVALGHAALVVALSPSLYMKTGETLEDVLQRGEEAMRQQRYAEAMQCFRRVMDAQPKPPPIFVKAAEQHRLADRLARQSGPRAEVPAIPANGGPDQPPSGLPATKPAPPAATLPAPTTHTKPPSYIPPELRPK
jgi:hypothetical protein